MDDGMNLGKLMGSMALKLPGFVVIILNSNKELLLQKTSNEGWELPGGPMESGEGLEDTARKKVNETIGHEVSELKLLGAFRDSSVNVENEMSPITAVYMTDVTNGDREIRGLGTIQYFNIQALPEGLTEETRDFMELYLEYLSK